MSFLRFLRRIEVAAALILLSAIIALVLYSTIMRYSGHPPTWALEVVQSLFAWVCFLAADIALYHSSHFGVDIIFEKLTGRAARVLEGVQLILIAALLGCLIYYSLKYVGQTYMRKLPATGVSFSYVALAATTGLSLMVLTAVERLVGLIKPATTEKQSEQAHA